MKKEIHFAWESEKKIKISQVGRSNSLFYEAYQQALAGVTEIVRASTVYCGEKDPFCPSNGRANGSELSPNEDRCFYNYPNNIIVFFGERGAGKSSAMLTFVNGLKDRDSQLYNKEFLKEMTASEMPGISFQDISNMLDRSQFHLLTPIDPTTLENGSQILVVILARMYQMASDAWKKETWGEEIGSKYSAQERVNKKNELIQQFSNCYEHISAIKNMDKKHSEFDGLDVLAELGDSSYIKRELADLVGDLLAFCGRNKSADSYLVIQIDDTDMNVQQAYEILEDIRKYLVIPRVVIVMAADMNHLVQVIESSVIKSYNKKSDQASECAGIIARQYITKLFPQTRQINLPNLGTYFKEHADSITICYERLNQQILPDKLEEYPNVQDQIFRLIYRKTGLVFMKYKNLLHYIIPRNMRHLAHFLAMLVQMESIEDPDSEEINFFLSEHSGDICEHKKKLRTRLQNIQRFRDYFLTTWVTANLSEGHAKTLNSLVEIDISKKVRYACMHLPNSDQTENQYNYEMMVRQCIQSERTSTEEEESRFVFAIQTYFSLLAHSVVLEELIEFYDCVDPSSLEKEERNFSFLRLYPLFGSRLFYYNLKVDEEENLKCPLELSDKKKHNLQVRWNIPVAPLIVPSKYVVSAAVGLLSSMLMAYEPTENEKNVCLDLSHPIMNCLYLGDYTKVTPMVKSIFKGSEASSNKIDNKDWKNMRNSSLMTVLNWDIQQRIGQTLFSVLCNTDATKCEFADWILSLSKFYESICTLFREPTLTIKALRSIRFRGWLEMFKETKNWISDKNDADDWNAAISTLTQEMVFYTRSDDIQNTECTEGERCEKKEDHHAVETTGSTSDDEADELNALSGFSPKEENVVGQAENGEQEGSFNTTFEGTTE